MGRYEFPPISHVRDDGLLAVGGPINAEILITAYTQGIFPWPMGKGKPITWFCPDPRGVLFFSDIHLSHSFKKFLRQTLTQKIYQITFGKAFPQVIKECARVHADNNKGIWITNQMIEGYCSLFKAGYCFSVEIWEDSELVAGLYGVKIGHYFSGESMFHLKDNLSKLAIYSLAEQLKSHGVEWLDTQMVTPVVGQLGGRDIPRMQFLHQLKEAIVQPEIQLT